VEAGATVAVIEAMKMETPLESPAAGTISALYIEERQPIEPGAPLMALSRRA
jgi:urea carboxylase